MRILNRPPCNDTRLSSRQTFALFFFFWEMKLNKKNETLTHYCVSGTSSNRRMPFLDSLINYNFSATVMKPRVTASGINHSTRISLHDPTNEGIYFLPVSDYDSLSSWPWNGINRRKLDGLFPTTLFCILLKDFSSFLLYLVPRRLATPRCKRARVLRLHIAHSHRAEC